MAWNMDTAKRRALVKLQLRDKHGRWIEMGGGVKWYSSRLKKVVAGTVVGTKGENALVRLNKENPTHEPALVSVPAHNIEVVDQKASLSPKGPSADQTPEFEKPDKVADVEADPNAEADSDHMDQLKGPQHLAANYGITETSDGNTYITRHDDASIYSSARELKVGDELIAPAGADPTKPFSIGRNWATKETERLNKDGEGPIIGKVIAISENRYAVVQMAGDHTIPDRRNPDEMTDTVTVGLSNQVILATMGLKDALGDKVSKEKYAERPQSEEKVVDVAAPEAQSDHVGREVPEDQLNDEPAAPESAPEATGTPEAQPALETPVEDAPKAPEATPVAEAPAEDAPAPSEEPAKAPEEVPQDKATPVNDIVNGLAELEQASEDISSAKDALSPEDTTDTIDGSSFDVTAADGNHYHVTMGQDENGDWNFIVQDANGAETSSHLIGSEENSVLAESISKGSSAPSEKSAPEAPKDSAPAEKAPEAPAAPESYNENGLTVDEQRQVDGAMRLATRSYDQFKDDEGDRYKAMADELLAKGEERKNAGPAKESPSPEAPATPETNAPTDQKDSTPAEKPEKASESAPQPEKAPEAAPEADKPVEDAPAPSLVEPDAAPEEAPASAAKPEPFGITFERGNDGLDHAVAARPEAMTPTEAEEFRTLNAELAMAQHENRSGREAVARGKLSDLGRRVQSRLDSESMASYKNDGPAKDSLETTPENASEAPKPKPKPTPEAKHEKESKPEAAPEDAPKAPEDSADEPTLLTDEEIGKLHERLNGPSTNEDGLLPDEAARLADLENRQSAALRGNSTEDAALLDQEITELIRHGRLRGRGRDVGPFRASNPVPDPAPKADAPEPDVPAETPAVPEATPAAPAAPRTRARNGEATPVADADGNMITRGDKVGHPTLGPVKVINTIPGSGRIEFIDPVTGRTRSVKAANVRRIDPNAVPAEAVDTATTATPGERFVDSATGKLGFGDKNGNRVLVGDRVTDANGNEGSVVSVYTAASGQAWIPVKWDADGKTRRVMGAQLSKSDPTVSPAAKATPKAAPAPVEASHPSTTTPHAPEPSRGTPSTTAPAVPENAPVPDNASNRFDMLSSAPAGTTLSHEDGTIYTKDADGRWVGGSSNLSSWSMSVVASRSPNSWVTNKAGTPEAAPKASPEAATPAPTEPTVLPTVTLSDTPTTPVVAGVNITELSVLDRMRAFRQAPIGSKMTSTGGKVFTKTGDREWTNHLGETFTPADLSYFAGRADVSGPYGLTLPETHTAQPNTLPTDRIERSRAIAALPIGTVITIGDYTFTKTGENNWEPTGFNEPHNDMDVAYAGSRSTPGTFALPQPKPIPQDLASRQLVAGAPIGTVVTNTTGGSFTKISDTKWADTATGNYKWGIAEFASMLKNNPYTGDFFVEGFDVPEPTPQTGLQIEDMAGRVAYVAGLPTGSTVSHALGREFRKVSPNVWVDNNGNELVDREVAQIARHDGWSVTPPPEAPPAPAEVIHDKLPVGSFLPSADGAKSGMKRVGPDKWEMIKDGQPTGRFVTDDTVKMFQELMGTSPAVPTDNRFGNNVGMYAEDLKLPGGASLGKYIEDGGSFSDLTTEQKQAVRAGYSRFIENLNTQLPEGFRAELQGNISFGTDSMTTFVQFYQGTRALGAAERRFSTTTDSRTNKRVSSVEHAFWALADDVQGSGLSAAFLNASKQMYRQMGLNRITVHADISIGSYAWARGGFDFRSPHYMASAMSAWEGSWGLPPLGREAEWSEGIRQFNELKAKATREAFMNGTHPPAVAFANIGRPEGNAGSDVTWFGKEMLKHTHWYGDFMLNSNVPPVTVEAVPATVEAVDAVPAAPAAAV